MSVRVQHMQILAGSTEREIHRERRGLMQETGGGGGDGMVGKRDLQQQHIAALSLFPFLPLPARLTNTLSLHQH